MKNYYLILFCASLCTVINLINADMTIILFWHNPDNNKYQVLLGRNAGTAIWSAFETVDPKKGKDAIPKILSAQTHNFYDHNLLLNQMQVFIYNRQPYYFIPASNNLCISCCRKARNAIKSEFTWVDADVLASFDPVCDPKKRKSCLITVDPYLRRVLRALWPRAKKKFASQAQS